MSNNPNWWTSEHDSRWDKVKTAFARDWEQTKHDFGSKAAPNLHQDAGDTVKQATASTGSGTHDFAGRETAFRYGHGAQSQYSDAKWDDSLETRMRAEYPGEWDQDRDYVRHGYGYKSKE